LYPDVCEDGEQWSETVDFFLEMSNRAADHQREQSELLRQLFPDYLGNEDRGKQSSGLAVPPSTGCCSPGSFKGAAAQPLGPSFTVGWPVALPDAHMIPRGSGPLP